MEEILSRYPSSKLLRTVLQVLFLLQSNTFSARLTYKGLRLRHFEMEIFSVRDSYEARKDMWRAELFVCLMVQLVSEPPSSLLGGR